MAVKEYEKNGTPNDSEVRTPGMLLRRVSLIHTAVRPDFAPISNAYDSPENMAATKPDGTYCNYTPVASDSTIRISVSLHCYSGNSSPNYAPYSTNFHFSYIFQIGSEYTGRSDYGTVEGERYVTLTTEVPSWGEGSTRAVALRMTNYNGSGHYRTNISYNKTINTGNGIIPSSRPKMVIEEFSTTEPKGLPIIKWNASEVDY